MRGDSRLASGEPAGDAGTMLLRLIDDHIMPLSCVFCRSNTQRERRRVCAGCAADLPRRPSPPPPVGSPLTCLVAPYAYDFPMDAAIKAFKFGRRLWYGAAFADLLVDAAGALPTDIDALLPVPLHWRRRWYRGFNQADELARPVARHLGVPVLRHACRVRATPFQSGLDATHRRGNLRGAFRVRGELSCRHALLVDDVVTTGATLETLARVVLDAGATRVSALAVCRASSRQAGLNV